MAVVIQQGNFTATLNEDAKGIEKVLKGLAYLGPWCDRCSKKGETCSGRAEAGCAKRVRAATIRRLTRKEGFGRASGWQVAEYRAAMPDRYVLSGQVAGRYDLKEAA